MGAAVSTAAAAAVSTAAAAVSTAAAAAASEMSKCTVAWRRAPLPFRLGFATVAWRRGMVRRASNAAIYSKKKPSAQKLQNFVVKNFVVESFSLKLL